jgi:hypothetical protein
MRFMVLVKANKDSEAGVMPSEQLLRDMGNFNEQLVKAGVMLAVEMRQVFEAEDFGAEFTPELREQEERVMAEAAKLNAKK